MARAEASRQRCAIYTRKSSEEGLEQEFNSLAAQREATDADQRHAALKIFGAARRWHHRRCSSKGAESYAGLAHSPWKSGTIHQGPHPPPFAAGARCSTAAAQAVVAGGRFNLDEFAADSPLEGGSFELPVSPQGRGYERSRDCAAKLQESLAITTIDALPKRTEISNPHPPPETATRS